MFCCRAQIPVGFGGFQIAFLDSFRVRPSERKHQPFTLIYDCGSLAETLAKEWAERIGKSLSERDTIIDLAVLSHTDFDHVCGIEALVAKVQVNTLMLPLLAPPFRAAVEAATPKSRPKWYREFVHSPVSWARERGIKKVVFVRPRNSDDGDPDFNAENPTEIGESDPIQSNRESPDPHFRDAVCMPSSEPIVLATGNRREFWQIVPVLAPLRDEDQCRASLHSILKGRSLSEIAQGLSLRKRSSLRNQLAGVYRRHWTSTNRSSVMLIIAPNQGNNGWLCTGDANLKEAATLQALQQCQALLHRVEVVQIPHHGSPHNFDRDTARALSRLCGSSPKWIVSSGKNRWCIGETSSASNN